MELIEADQRNGERLSLVLRGSTATCRVQPWSFRPEVAQLVMYQQQQLPAVADLHRWSDRLRDLGYTSVRTTALATATNASNSSASTSKRRAALARKSHGAAR